MLDIIMNFLALIVITEFDDAFFFIVQHEKLALLLTDKEFEHVSKQGEKWMVELDEILKIECTTSNYARMRVVGNRLRLAKNEKSAAIVDTTALEQKSAEDDQKARKKIDDDKPNFIYIKQRER